MRLYRVRPGGHWYRPAVHRLRPGMSLAVALVGGAALAPVLAWIGELNTGWFTFGAYALLCGLIGALSRVRAAPLIGLAAWLFLNGFAVHRYAVLGWDQRGADWMRLVLFTGTALAAAAPATLPRRRIRIAPVPAPRHG